METVLDAVRAGSVGAPAIGAPDRPPLTYGGLAGLIEQVGADLNRFGIGRGDRVAIVLPNGPEMATAFLTVAASASAAPLNPAYKKDEFAFCLEDLGAKAIIVEAGGTPPALEAADELGVPVLTIAWGDEDFGRFLFLRNHRPEWPARSARFFRTIRRSPCPAHIRHHVAPESGAAQRRQRAGLGRPYPRHAAAHRQ